MTLSFPRFSRIPQRDFVPIEARCSPLNPLDSRCQGAPKFLDQTPLIRGLWSAFAQSVFSFTMILWPLIPHPSPPHRERPARGPFPERCPFLILNFLFPLRIVPSADAVSFGFSDMKFFTRFLSLRSLCRLGSLLPWTLKNAFI